MKQCRKNFKIITCTEKTCTGFHDTTEGAMENARKIVEKDINSEKIKIASSDIFPSLHPVVRNVPRISCLVMIKIPDALILATMVASISENTSCSILKFMLVFFPQLNM